MKITRDTQRAHAEPIDTLLATLLYLMSGYAHSPETRLAPVIARHLDYVTGHPECRSGALSHTAERLRRHWAQHHTGSRLALENAASSWH